MAKLTRKEAFDRLNIIINGIDQDANVSPFGWWDVSNGPAWGARKRVELVGLVDELLANCT